MAGAFGKDTDRNDEKLVGKLDGTSKKPEHTKDSTDIEGNHGKIGGAMDVADLEGNDETLEEQSVDNSESQNRQLQQCTSGVAQIEKGIKGNVEGSKGASGSEGKMVPVEQLRDLMKAMKDLESRMEKILPEEEKGDDIEGKNYWRMQYTKEKSKWQAQKVIYEQCIKQLTRLLFNKERGDSETQFNLSLFEISGTSDPKTGGNNNNLALQKKGLQQRLEESAAGEQTNEVTQQIQYQLIETIQERNDQRMGEQPHEDELDKGDIVRDTLDTIKTRVTHASKDVFLSLRQSNHNDVPIENVPENNIQPLDFEPATSDEEECCYATTKLRSSLEPLVIKVKPAERFMDQSDCAIGRYYMRKKPHGYVLIITIKEYIGHDEVRQAAEHDAANLKKLFEDMGFDVTLPDPSVKLTGVEIKRIVKEFSQKDFGKVDSCFVIISAHGGETKYKGTPQTVIYGCDYGLAGSEPVLCSDIVEMFTAKNTKHLDTKPKVFIFQTCRGEVEQQIIRTAADGIMGITRNYSDILIAYSTIQGHKAYRDVYNGSWYIQILCEVFMKYACTEHIIDLFIMIDTKLRSLLEVHNDKAQTSSVQFDGFLHLYLNPGIFEEYTAKRSVLRSAL